jgi:hypothetical protein
VRREVCHGEKIPRGYGVAFTCWDRPSVICYPIPLNLAINWIRAAYHGLVWGLTFKATREDKLHHAEALVRALRLRVVRLEAELRKERDVRLRPRPPLPQIHTTS